MTDNLTLSADETEMPHDHAFLPVAGHPDDDECTWRSDGTDETYCGWPAAAHDFDAEETEMPQRAAVRP